MTSQPKDSHKQGLTGVILAGGLGRRMGGQDKGLVTLRNRPMIDYVIAALRPQVDELLINANRNQDAYSAYGCPVITDSFPDYAGPLAGMATALEAMTGSLLLTAPCDCPFPPADLAERLHAALIDHDAEIVAAHDGNRLQPVFALITPTLLPSLQSFLKKGGRRIDEWYGAHRFVTADFSDQPEAFLNLNRLEDKAALEASAGATH